MVVDLGRLWVFLALVGRGSLAKDPPLKYSNQAPLGICEGDCDGDEDCELGLSCFRRNYGEEVDGCFGDGVHGVDYCYDPPVGVLVRKRIRTNNKDEPLSPVGECKGECRNDGHCKSGLRCFSREAYEEVPGCTGRGIKGLGYCYYKTKQTTNKNRDSDDDKKKIKTAQEPPKEYPPQVKKPTYMPGKPSVIENGLLLSKGLTARIIAIKGQKVKYDVGNGKSKRNFHILPDGGAVFADEKTGGWIYVSNSEDGLNGGVGAITFNSKGEVVDYSWLLDGTERNCGGGKTYWNTWLSCEEVPDGHVWEVDPWNRDPPRRTIMSGKDGDRFEAAAYDNRNKREPVFYVTIDREDGPLLKFTPDKKAVQVALNSNPPNYKNLLHTNQTGTAKLEYLVLQPKQSNPDKGTLFWTENKQKAEKSASRYYSKCEGIDIRNGVMYVTCKAKRSLFVFDLDKQTYQRETTWSGAFRNLPDQVARIVGKGNNILYFCEGGGKPLEAGVHGRDANGNFYTILENAGQDPDFHGETSGLAFSPDNRHMYLVYMKPGIVFDITRRDGFPFGGQRLDIKLRASWNVFQQN